MKNTFDIDSMVEGYLECAAWSTSNIDENGQEIENLEGYDFSESAKAQALKDCQDFVDMAGDLLADIDASQAGHDFWLTRERHGAGFWDRGLGETGEELTKLAHSFGDGNLYLGDDELLYFA